MPFSQSPIEAFLWTYFVSIQEWLADNVILTSMFTAAMVLWFTHLFIKACFRATVGNEGPRAFVPLAVNLIFSALGIAVLKAKSDNVFTPLNATGSAWKNAPKVASSPKYQGFSALSPRGLSFYVSVHGTVNELSGFISGKISEFFGDQVHNSSPYLLFETLAKTAGASIDDPKSVSQLDWLYENCADSAQAPVLGASSSYSALFDLTKEGCDSKFAEFKQTLGQWGSQYWADNFSDLSSAAKEKISQYTGSSLNDEALKNKMIASALLNSTRLNKGMGPAESKEFNSEVNPVALLGSKSFGAADMTNFYQSHFTLTGALNATVGKLTGVDFVAADARNEAAFIYNKLIQFLAPIRGYAKGSLAIAFVFAAAAMCFGSPRFMISWFGMLLLFTIYEPISALLYHSTLLFSYAKENADAFAAVKSDPLVLGGAAIIDGNLSRIQTVYFLLQTGLIIVCASAGIYVFMFAKKIGSGLTDGMVSAVTRTQGVAGMVGAASARGEDSQEARNEKARQESVASRYQQNSKKYESRRNA